MNVSSRKQRVIDAWEAAWDRGEVEVLDGILSPDYRRRSTAGEEGETREELKASIITTRAAFPDLVTQIDEILEEGDRMAVRWHSVGRHERSFLGVPATGLQVRVQGATFARFEDDLVVEEQVTWDPRALLTALGIIHVGEDR